MKYLEGADYFVRIVKFPVPVGGLVSPNEDGTFNIYINDDFPPDRRMESYEHEISHIENDDFYNGKNIGEVEHF